VLDHEQTAGATDGRAAELWKLASAGYSYGPAIQEEVQRKKSAHLSARDIREYGGNSKEGIANKAAQAIGSRPHEALDAKVSVSWAGDWRCAASFNHLVGEAIKFTLATPPSEDPQSAASRLIARRER
jgi:hypothetical protein